MISLTRWLFLSFAWLYEAAMVSAAEPFEAFLEKHGVACHGPEKEKGDLPTDQLSQPFQARCGWPSLDGNCGMHQRRGMQPEDEELANEGKIATVIAALDSRIREGRASQMASRPLVAHKRLSRKEYQITVYDLFVRGAVRASSMNILSTSPRCQLPSSCLGDVRGKIES